MILEAMEQDVGTSSLLGSTAPLDWSDLCSFEGVVKHKVDLKNEHAQIVGNIAFKTQLLWQEYVPPKASSKLDKKSRLRIVIKEATFKKDADTFGKQDPFISFKYQGVDLKTDVKDDAGKRASWDETFLLPNILTEYRNGNEITFEAYD